MDIIGEIVMKKTEKTIADCLVVIMMALLMALNYQIFIFENSFAPAGLNGIATMVQYKLHFSVGYMNLLLNVPLCVAAFFLLGRDFAAKTLCFCLAFSLFILMFKYKLINVDFMVYKTANGTSTILAPVAAGVVNGFIYGNVLRHNACTGGTDVVAEIVHHKKPEKNIVWIIFVMNCVVAAASFFVYDYKFEPVILCVVYSFLTSRISDMIIRGGKAQIKFEIVTRDYEAISREIIEKTHHTATVIPAKGMFSGKETDMLVCVVNKHQIIKLQEIVSKYPGSFAYISGVNEIFGNYNLTGRQRHAQAGVAERENAR